MGKKDEYQIDYLDDNRIFADQINGALFNGRQIVKPEELEPDESQMVLRNMLSESLGYRRQWKRKKHAHGETHDLRNRNEYLSGIKKDEKFAPIITLVVYFGTSGAWDGAKCLYDLLEIDDELKAYVTNYRLNLYDCHEHDTFEEYKTGLRQVFETVRYARDKKKLKEVMEASREAYSSLDSDTRNMLEVVANIKIPEEYKMVAERKERYNMCKAFEDMRQEGYDEGIEKGIRALIQTCAELGIPDNVIIEKCAEKYEMTQEKARKYVEAYCVCAASE